jgi:hypothetical protein
MHNQRADWALLHADDSHRLDLSTVDTLAIVSTIFLRGDDA